MFVDLLRETDCCFSCCLFGFEIRNIWGVGGNQTEPNKPTVSVIRVLETHTDKHSRNFFFNINFCKVLLQVCLRYFFFKYMLATSSSFV